MNKIRIRGMLSSKRTQMGESWLHRYDGLVYLVWFPRQQMHKIGHTRSLDRRIRRLKYLYGEQPELVHTIGSNWPYAAEQILIAGCELAPIVGREAGKLTPEAIAEITSMVHMEIESPERNEFAVKTVWRD